MAGLFISQTFNLFLLGQPVSSLNWIRKALQLLPQGHVAVLSQIGAGDDDIPWPLNRKAMGTGTLKGQRHVFAFAFHQQRSYCFDCSKAHARRSSRCKNAEDQLFPKARVRTFVPDIAKLEQSSSN